MKKTIQACLALTLCLSTAPLVAQNVPLAISYQAVLTDDNGNLLSPTAPTNYNVQFRVFDAVQNGNRLWAEAQTVSVYQGSFSTMLGTGAVITGESRPQLDTIFGGAQRFLEITLLSGTPKTYAPRQQMVSTPFAFRAKTAEVALSVSNNIIGNANLTSGSVTIDKMAYDSVDANRIQANAVGSSEITANAVGTEEIANGSVNLDKLAAALAQRLVPAGSVTAYAGLTAASTVSGVSIGGIPDGWIFCDGRTLSKDSYPALFNAIGYIYGGSGTNFNVPDYRGMFHRGFSVDATQDPDRATRTGRTWLSGLGWMDGSTQGDMFRSHNHSNGVFDSLVRRNGDGGYTETNTDRSYGEFDQYASATMTNAGGNETRPKNTYVHYIIKAH